MVFREGGVSRLALRPFTFSNGVTIPAGTLVSLPIRPIHVDEDIYPNAQEFDGYRFLKLREESGNMAAKHQMVTASAELLSFGFGRHAWWVIMPASFCSPRPLIQPITRLLIVLGGTLRRMNSRRCLPTFL